MKIDADGGLALLNLDRRVDAARVSLDVLEEVSPRRRKASQRALRHTDDLHN
jgi:hypothetical protein